MKCYLRLVPILLVVALALLSGCAGSSGDESFVGCYNGSYTRASGLVTVGVNSSSVVSVGVFDDVKGYFTGTAILDHHLGFSATCFGLDGKSVLVTGTFSGSGNSRSATGAISGEFSSTFSVAFSSNEGHAQFADHYEGFFLGGVDGLFEGDVDSSGHFVGTWTFDGHTFEPMTGQVDSSGFAEFDSTFMGDTVNVVGVFFEGPTDTAILCHGNWTSSNGDQGTWDGGNAHEG